MKKPKLIKAIHILYFDDLSSKPEVNLDGEFVVRDINGIQMLVNKAFEKYRRDRILGEKKAKKEKEENENGGSDNNTGTE